MASMGRTRPLMRRWGQRPQLFGKKQLIGRRPIPLSFQGEKFSGLVAQLAAGLALYDAFHLWCRDATEEVHNWPGQGTR